MAKGKLVLSIMLALLLALPLVSAEKVGISVTPSSGEYTFGTLGGRLDLLATNFGDSAGSFSLELSGAGAAYATVGSARITIEPGKTEKFTITVSGGPAGERLPLVATVRTSSASGESATATANLRLSYSGQSGSNDYVTGNIAAVGSSDASLANKLFAVVAAALLVGLGYYLIKTRGPWKD